MGHKSKGREIQSSYFRELCEVYPNCRRWLHPLVFEMRFDLNDVVIRGEGPGERDRQLKVPGEQGRYCQEGGVRYARMFVINLKLS